MANIFIIHGTGGDPECNWFPWLKTELEKSGHNVYAPKFPTPKNQSIETWLNVFSGYEKHLNESAVVIGHSLGSAFLLSVLEKLDHPIKTAYLVSGFIGLIDNPEFDELNRTFTIKDFNWAKIKKNCKSFYVINSDNDPYVPIQKGQELARNLSAKLIILHGAGHINKDSGYLKFCSLLDLVLKNK